MKFVVLNARINAHNCSWADEIYNILGSKFTFIEYKSIPNFQKGSFSNSREGKDYHEGRPYVLKMYESEESRQKAFQLIESAEVLRFSGCPFEWVKHRIDSGKLTFCAGERMFKKPIWRHSPITLAKLINIYRFHSTPNFRILCQSAYLPNDMSYFGDYNNKCYKFAYIHQFPELGFEELKKFKQTKQLDIMWCARFLDLKHPELPVLLAKKLVESGRKEFHINMVGSNTMKLWDQTKKLVSRSDMDDYVTLTGGIPNAEVLRMMRESNVFLFTSDRNEGWGVVLNEAMSSGCACVASNEIGSVPFLIEDGKNGLIFKSKSVESLYQQVLKLYDDRNLCDEMGENAYRTITEEWGAKNVAQRLVDLCESILNGNELNFRRGPLSKAYPIK